LYAFLTVIVLIVFTLLLVHFVENVYKPYRRLRNQEEKQKQDDFRQRTIIALLPAPTV
jgi:cbb3-type cytochrome oxidase subunit 3